MLILGRIERPTCRLGGLDLPLTLFVFFYNLYGPFRGNVKQGKAEINEVNSLFFYTFRLTKQGIWNGHGLPFSIRLRRFLLRGCSHYRYLKVARFYYLPSSYDSRTFIVSADCQTIAQAHYFDIHFIKRMLIICQ